MIVVKKYSGEWCGPCRMLAPMFNEVKAELNGSGVQFMDVDVDMSPDDAQKNSIRSVPTVLVFRDGLEVERFSGIQSKMAYINAIKSHLENI